MSVVFAALLTLCLGGAVTSFLLVQRLDPRGPASPKEALDGFLNAIFVDRSSSRAADFVCAEKGDDKSVARLVFDVRNHPRRYESPRTTWTYPPVQRTGRHDAAADVTLVLTTVTGSPETKRVRLSLTEDRGWWVCDVEAP